MNLFRPCSQDSTLYEIYDKDKVGIEPIAVPQKRILPMRRDKDNVLLEVGTFFHLET